MTTNFTTDPWVDAPRYRPGICEPFGHEDTPAASGNCAHPYEGQSIDFTDAADLLADVEQELHWVFEHFRTPSGSSNSEACLGNTRDLIANLYGGLRRAAEREKGRDTISASPHAELRERRKVWAAAMDGDPDAWAQLGDELPPADAAGRPANAARVPLFDPWVDGPKGC